MSRTRAARPRNDAASADGPAEQLDQQRAGDVEPLGHRGVHRRVEPVGLPGDLLQPPADPAGRQDEHRQQDQRQQRDLPGQREHHAGGEHQPDHVGDDAGQRRGERPLGADDVVVEPADQRAGLGAGEERTGIRCTWSKTRLRRSKMMPSPMRAEYQRVASEMRGVEHGEPGDEQRDPDDVAGRAVEAGDPVDDVAGQQRGDHADQRRADHERQEERSARGGTGRAKPRIRRTVPFGSSRAVTDGSRRNDRMAAMDVIGWLTSTPPPSSSTGQHRGPAGLFRTSLSVPLSAPVRRAPAAGGPGRPARRRPGLAGSLRTAERTSAAVARLARHRRRR